MGRPKPSSRENGHLSRGPKTQAGKDRSKLNGLRHGIFASETVLYKDDSGEALTHEIEQYTAELCPKSNLEVALTRRIAQTRIRRRRLGQIEALFLAELARTEEPGSPNAPTRGAGATLSFEGRTFDTLLRLDARLARECLAAHRLLLRSQGKQIPKKILKVTDRT